MKEISDEFAILVTFWGIKMILTRLSLGIFVTAEFLYCYLAETLL